MLFLLMFAATLNGFPAGEWIKVTPVGGGFSIMMPAKPEEEVNPRDDFTSHLFTVRTAYAIYSAGYIDYAPSIRLDVARELEANRDAFVKSLEAKLLESKSITLDGHAGIEFTADSDQAWIKSRIYLFGSRMHQISVAVFKSRDETDNVNRFFASFAFTKA